MFLIQSFDLSQVFGCDLEQNQTGVMMKEKCPHYPQYSYDIIRIHSLMRYSDIIEYNIISDTKIPLMRCIPFISKEKGRYMNSTGRRYMNYPSFTITFAIILVTEILNIYVRFRMKTYVFIPRFILIFYTRCGAA